MTGKQNFTPLIKDNWWQDGLNLSGDTTLTRQITLTPAEVDQLIVADLTYMFDLLHTGENSFYPDADRLSSALMRVLEEYMAPADFEEWNNIRGQ